MVKFLSHFWAAAVGLFADCLTCPEDAVCEQNLKFSGQSRGEKFSPADQQYVLWVR